MPDAVINSADEHCHAASQTASIEALVVPPKIACKMLSCGTTQLYALLKSGELKSYQMGRVRRIVVTSIHEHIKRRLGATPTKPIAIEKATAASLKSRRVKRAVTYAAERCRRAR